MHFTIKSLLGKNVKVPGTFHEILCHWLDSRRFPRFFHLTSSVGTALLSLSGIDNPHRYVIYFIS